MIKKISIILFLLLNLIYAQKKVPNWFINLPESNNHSMYAVGYTGAFYDSIQAKSVAEYRAIKNMTRQKQIQLIFEVTQLSDGRYRLFKPSFEQIYEEYILHEIIDNYSVVDSVFTKNGCYVLIQYPASVKKTKDFVSEIQHWSNKPGWVDKLPINNKYIYGIGITANYSRNYRAWQDTDNYSRFDLGKNISVNSQSVKTHIHFKIKSLINPI